MKKSISPHLIRKMRRDQDELVGKVEDDGYVETKEDKLSLDSRYVHRISGGVSVQWLAKAFGITRHSVTKRIGKLRPVRDGDFGNPLYDLREAAQLLVDPIVDIQAYLKNAKVDDLPEHLKNSIWTAKLNKQKWEEKAGDLWRTEKVMVRFAEVLGNTRTRLQQIPDRLERLTGLSIEQYRIIRNIVDEVQEEMYDEIISMSKYDTTPNQLGEEGIGKPEREDLS